MFIILSSTEYRTFRFWYLVLINAPVFIDIKNTHYVENQIQY